MKYMYAYRYFVMSTSLTALAEFLQRVSIASIAKRCTIAIEFCLIVCLSVCLTVRHSPVLCQNDSS